MTDDLARLQAALAGRYRLERELGAGGMATVHLAEDLKHHRRVAIKVLRPELATALGPDRFLREIETTASLRHPHILPLYDSGEAGGFLFYVMPYVEGESLRERLAREKQLPLDDALQIAREVADALGYAHERGVIHRDIKPENILLERGHAVVADFGIARAVFAAGGERLTQTGIAVGTPAYMSPEQSAGSGVLDGRSDVYALGCLLYEMLAGQPPFTGPTAESLVHQHLTVAPRAITQVRPTVPAHVAAALTRALAKTPADRFSLIARFADALTADGPPPLARPPGRRRTAVGAAIVGLALVALLVYLLRRGAPSPLALGRRTQVTLDPGLELDPALSPDGKFLAYSGPRGDLLVRQVDGGLPIQVVREGDPTGRWPAWVPDGQRLMFISPRGIEVAPALGGVPRLRVAGGALARGLTVAPDGRSFAFAAHDSIYRAPLDGGAGRLVAVSREVHSLAWSPDGRWIAFVSGNIQYVAKSDLGNVAVSSIWVVPAAGGAAVQVSDDQSLNVSPTWAGDRLLYISDREGSRDAYAVRLTRAGTRAAPPERLTTGLNAHGITVSSDGSRLAYSAFTEVSNAWSVAIPARGGVSVSEARPVTTGNQTIENLGVSVDGRWIGFSSVRGSTSQIYALRLGGDGNQPRQLTADPAGSYWLDWSPDGREIAFHRFRGERRQAFVMAVDGGAPVPVTDGSEDERSPEWAPDGRRLLLLANWGTHPALHIVTRGSDGRWSAPHAVPVVIDGDTITSGLAAWSPDGRLLACGCGPGGLVIVPLDGGPAYRLPSPFPTDGWAFPQWSTDGRTVFHLMEESGHVTAVVAVPLSGAPPRVVLRFDDPTRPWHRFGFRVRGDALYFTLGDLQSDIWVADVERR